jgi:large subunit ribosomal protein L47
VLLKERNLLATERAGARAAREKFLNPQRLWKVRKSMARLKLVLTERALAEAAVSGDEQALMMDKACINAM